MTCPLLAEADRIDAMVAVMLKDETATYLARRASEGKDPHPAGWTLRMSLATKPHIQKAQQLRRDAAAKAAHPPIVREPPNTAASAIAAATDHAVITAALPSPAPAAPTAPVPKADMPTENDLLNAHIAAIAAIGTPDEVATYAKLDTLQKAAASAALASEEAERAEVDAIARRIAAAGTEEEGEETEFDAIARRIAAA